MNSPLISVLLPLFNGEKYVFETIKSILNQSYNNFELIIINDGSNDNSLKEINKFNDNRIRLINQQNQGLAKSLNIAASLSKGKYLARIDQDDICLPNRFQIQINYLEKNEKISVVGGASIYINEKGKNLGRGFTTTWPISIKRTLLNQNGCLISHPTVMMRKVDFDDVGGYSESIYKNSADYFLWFCFVKKQYKIANLSDVLIKYRLHESSMSASTSTYLKEDFNNADLLNYNNLSHKEKLKVDETMINISHNVFSKRVVFYKDINFKIYSLAKPFGEKIAVAFISFLKNIYNLSRN